MGEGTLGDRVSHRGAKARRSDELLKFEYLINGLGYKCSS